MSWSHTGNTRSSIFETFHTPSFGDDDLDTSEDQAGHVSLSKLELVGDVDDDVQCEAVEEDLTTTLWMSCSPGRDSTDQDEDEDEEDEDDSLPLSCFQTSKGSCKQSTSTTNTKHKKPGKPVKKHKRKEKGRHAPKRPMSAYSLFFRDTQSSIKAQNPQATFGDISRIVASMWESLDAHDKDEYNNMADKAKQAYLEELDDYKDSNKISSNTKPSSTKSQHKSKQKLSDDSESEMSSDTALNKVKPNVAHCSRTDCDNIAVNDTRWDNDFCSVDCVVSHCKDVFIAWVSSPRGVKVE